MKLKDPRMKNSHPTNELMLDPNEIRYMCIECNVLFNNIPEDECLYCGNEFHYNTYYQKNGITPPAHPVTDQDYMLW